MIQRRKLIRIFLLLLFILFFVFSVLSCLYFFIPIYLESGIIPQAAKKIGIEDFSCDIRHIGFFDANFGAFRVGSSYNPSILLESVQLYYSPKELYNGYLKRVVFSGVELYCEYKNGEFGIRGFDLKRFLARIQAGDNVSSSPDMAPAILIGSVEIRNSIIFFEWNGFIFRLPLEITVVPEDANWSSIITTLKLYPRGHEVSSTINIDLNSKNATLRFDAANIHLERFSDLAKLVPELSFTGTVAIEGGADIALKPFKINSAGVDGRFHSIRASYHNLRFENSVTAEKETMPFHIEINGSDGKPWDLHISSFAIASPIPLEISGINCTVNSMPDAIDIAGGVGIVIKQLSRSTAFPAIVAEPIHLYLGFSATHAKTGSWEFMAGSKTGKKSTPSAKGIKLGSNDFKITTLTPEIDISGNGTNTEGTATYRIMLPAVRTIAEKVTLKTPGVLLKGKTVFSSIAEKDRVHITLALQASDMDLAVGPSGSTRIRIPRTSFSGKLLGQDISALHFEGGLKLDNAEISDTKLGAVISGISADIPIRWPFGRSGRKGSLTIKDMQWQNLKLGSIKGAILQEDTAFLLQGKYISDLLPGLSLDIRGKADILADNRPAELNLILKKYRPLTDIDLGKFIPSAKGILVNGELEAKGNLASGASGIESSLSLKLKNATVLSEERKLAIEGIHLSLLLPDLLNLHSAPNQRISFNKIALGGLNAVNGSIDFEIESLDSFFIEKSRLKWCNGNLFTHAIRIVPSVDEYSLTVYCDRLRLAELLEQIGSVKATGNGTVNGRIPISFKNKQIRFSDGFLYSTPGDGGSIRLAGTEILTAGIPENTPQFAQLDLAREALKDYNYQWVKLNLATEEDILLLRMQLDGKPVKPLPFVYKKEIGGFAKVEAGSKGSIFQGIGLDVNLRIPLDKILHYGENIKNVLDITQ